MPTKNAAFSQKRTAFFAGISFHFRPFMFDTRPWEVEFELAWFFVIHFHFKTMCNAILTHFIFKTDVRYYFFCCSSTYPENYIYLLETDRVLGQWMVWKINFAGLGIQSSTLKTKFGSDYEQLLRPVFLCFQISLVYAFIECP